MKPAIKLHHLRDFVAIARHQSVRSAARTLGMAQPALTRSLRDLEHLLETALVERHARGVVLTSAGERFRLRAQSAIEEVRRAAEELAQLEGSKLGAVAVGLSMAAILALAPSAVRTFRLSYPDAYLNLVEGSFPIVKSRLFDGELDFYVGPPPEELPRELHAELWFRNERVIVARKQHPLLRAGSLKKLVKADWILTGLRERAEQEFEEMFNSFKLPTPKSLTRVQSTLGLLTILSSTDSLAVLPRQWTDTPLFKDVLAPISVKEKLPAADIVLISRAGMPLTPIAEHFAVLLQRAAGKPYK